MSKGALVPCPPTPVVLGTSEEEFVTVGNVPTAVKSFPLPASTIIQMTLRLVGHSDEGGRYAFTQRIQAAHPAVGVPITTAGGLMATSVDGAFGVAFSTGANLLTLALSGASATETIQWRVIFEHVQAF